ncbi:cytochrome P450 [Phycomyces nitens]|nr:cytochrome P450 [Phycomyces nitens]
MASNTTSLIVALKGAHDLEEEGYIIQIGNGASVENVRNLAAEKLDVVGSTADITLEDSEGNPLNEIDQIRSQKVVYLNPKDSIKDVIPGPTKLPYIGNLYDMMPDMNAGFLRFFKKYGPLVDVSILGTRMVATCDPEIAEIFVKESEYFTKKIKTTLKEIKNFAGQGLFTTDTSDPDWKLAHKLLMPAFSPRAIKVYQNEMGIIAQETIRILEQYKPDEKVEILHWTTNLTFETIGKIGFGYEFGLLDKREAPPHPFIEAMGYCLKQSIARFSQAQFIKTLPLEMNRRFDREVDLMHSTVDKVIQERKQSEDATNIEKDLLGFMLNARDEHHQGLSDENIRDQVVTFLIAGHDTTANTLAWFLYEISLQPEIEAKVLQEIANVGITHTELPSSEQVGKLKYVHMCIKETLRMHPPVRMLGKYCQKDCVLPGGYKLEAGTPSVVHLYGLHLNPKVYPNPNLFDPERWTPEEEQKRSKSAWLPFSTGPRGCIGMAFALQEAKTVIGMFLHRFKFCYDGPPVQYDPKQPTTKPVDLLMTIHDRTDFPEPSASSEDLTPKEPVGPTKTMPVLDRSIEMASIKLPPITFLYGTQTGTSQDYASVLSNQARQFGFKDVTLTDMDKWKVLEAGKYEGPTGVNDDRELVVVCTATYNGMPPDNAEKFDKFLDKSDTPGNEKLLYGLKYTVFGIGNKNWRTYQHFPIKVDSRLDDLGADRFFLSGKGDTDGDIDSAFNDWSAHFWSHTLSYYGLAISKDTSIVPSSSANTEASQSAVVHYISPSDTEKWELGMKNCNGTHNAVVVENKELQQGGSERSTRDIRIDVSKLEPVGDDLLYLPGDHLEVMPENDPQTVEAVALGFGMVLDSVFEIDQSSIVGLSPRSLAATIKGPCTVRNALTCYADLLSPPSRRILGYFAAQLHKIAPETAEIFDSLTMPDVDNKDQYPEFIKKYRTLLDLQKGFPQVQKIEIGQFMAAVGVMQPRRYSIASSPHLFPKEAHLAVGVVDDVVNGKHYPGLASSFLAHQIPGKTNTVLRAKFKSSKGVFEMPADAETPIIMISAGTGISPFRGFLQERAYQHKQATGPVGECLVFFGCRREDQDRIYGDELDQYVKDGVISGLHVAFSRQTPPSPRKYVQHQVLANANEIWRLLVPGEGKKPAVVYICGSGAMSRDVRATFCSMAISFGAAKDEEEAEDFIHKLMEAHQYNEDVWG